MGLGAGLFCAAAAATAAATRSAAGLGEREKEGGREGGREEGWRELRAAYKQRRRRVGQGGRDLLQLLYILYIIIYILTFWSNRWMESPWACSAGAPHHSNPR